MRGCLVILALCIVTPALAEDYWTTCDEAYRFCERRGYHRDCAVWRSLGEPLSVNGSHYKPGVNAGTPFCTANPWHMACGSWELVFDHTECPIPDRFKRRP